MKNDFLTRLLDYYNIDFETYENLTSKKELEEIRSFEHFENINLAKDLVLSHIQNNKKIIIYGDYDADGILATSILMKAFEKFNYKGSYYIPNRYIDGYGINVENASKIIESGFDLVITVDNGVSANDAIALFKENNIKVVVLDHHQRQEILPNADFIIHPQISNYGEIPTSGAYVTYMFARALLGRHDRYLATLASLSLITDMMPLKEYNRELLKNVIDNYQYGEFYQLDLLLENQTFDDENISFLISPKINSIGRILKDTSINRIVKFFISDNPDEILTYYNWISSVNETRKELTKSAKESLLANLDSDSEKPTNVMLLNIEEGLIGLIANVVLKETNKPTIIFTESDKDPKIIKGSARAKEGFSITKCFELAKDFAITFGGHQLAGGITLYKKDLEKFEKIFSDFAFNNQTPVAKEDNLLEININEITQENYDLIKTFSPFGESWRAPKLALKHIKTSSLNYSKNKLHIFTQIGFNSRIVAFYPNLELINSSNYIDCIGNLRMNVFNNRKYIEFLIEEIRKD